MEQENKYERVEEALDDLRQIKPADLTSSKTSQAEAVRLCREVMKVILKCENLSFNEKQREEFSEQLKALGCAGFKTANEKFKSARSQTLGETLKLSADIQFPLSAFSNIIDVERETFVYGMGKMTEGGKENSWVGEWLASQGKESDDAKYESMEEALADLRKIKPADLKSSKTSQAEAVRLCREVLTVILKCENLNINEEEQKELSEQLKALGCAGFKTANKKFKSSVSQTFRETLKHFADIQFPLSAFSNIIDVERETFVYGMGKMTEGGKENSWVGEWLAAQEEDDLQVEPENE